MYNCPKCNSTSTRMESSHQYHDIYECLLCKYQFLKRLTDVCCRKPWMLVMQCQKDPMHLKLYWQCMNCGGSLNRNKPLKRNDYSHQIEGEFDDHKFLEWKDAIKTEATHLYEGIRYRNNQNSHYGKYRNYLRSDEWKRIRTNVLTRDQNTCRICKESPATEVHHLHYDNLFNEPLEDLIAICRACHELEHKKGEK